MFSNESLISGKYSDLAFLFVFPLHYIRKSLTKSMTHLGRRSKEGRWVINPSKTKDTELSEWQKATCLLLLCFTFSTSKLSDIVHLFSASEVKAIARLRTCI